MATTETARLKRETERTRAEVESTLFELRARMSPSSLMDQATEYLRSSSGRAFVGNLRDQVVENPVPVTLIGAGIAWLVVSGIMSRYGNGPSRNYTSRGDEERDWGRTGTSAYGMPHNDGRLFGGERVGDAAESWTGDGRSAFSEAGEAMGDVRERAGTPYDETMGRARQTTEDWAEDTREAASEAVEAMREGIDAIREGAGEMRDRAAGMYDQSMRRTRRAMRKAADYGRAARYAVKSDGALVTLCREQPMLIAGIGVAVGAALSALIPASRAEMRVMGEASREVRERASQAAAEGLRAATNGDECYGSDRRDESRASNKADHMADDADRGVEQAGWRPNTEKEPQSSAPYAEAAEAGAATAPGTTEARPG